MAMKVHNLKQGSPEWKAHRAKHRNASEAAAMLGESPYMKRSELMFAIHTGINPEPTDFQQAIFDSGHRFEAYARPLAEEIIGAELFPVTGTLEDTILSASLDGIEEDEKEIWEHKSLNAILREIMVGDFTGADLPIYYRIQMEQQLLVSSAVRVLFMASAWLERDNAEPDLIEERHVWYYPDPALRDRIVRGWAQLDEDLLTYTPPEVKPMIVKKQAVILPAIEVRVTGQLTVHADFAIYRKQFADYLESIPKKPATDQEFADCATALSDLKKVEDRMKEIAAGTIGSVASVQAIMDTAAAIGEQAREVRLATSKLVDKRKLEVKAEIAAEGVKGFADHIKALNERLGEPLMPTTGLAPDFGEAMKNTRTFDGARERVMNALNDARIKASAIADAIQINMRTIDAQDAKHAHLFAQDRAALVLKAAEDLAAIMSGRTLAFDAAEATRIAAEEARIKLAAQKATATAAAQRMARAALDTRGASIEQCDAVIASLESEACGEPTYGPAADAVGDARDAALETVRLHRADAVAALAARAPAPAPAPEPAAAPAPPPAAEPIAVTQRPPYFSGVAVHSGLGYGHARSAAPVNEPTFTAAPAPAPAVESTVLIRLGALCTAIGFNLTAGELSAYGVEAASKDGAAKLYAVRDFPRLRAAIVERLDGITIASLEAAANAKKRA